MFTVTSAASDRSLLTEAEARAAIGNPTADVAALIARVSAAITRACRVVAAGAVPPTLRLEAVQDQFRLKSHQRALVLSRRPVVSIGSLVENDVTLVEETDFEVDAAAGLLVRLSGDTEICWPCGKIVVPYSAGWETVPDDLKEAASRAARDFWSEGAQPDPNLKREEIPGVITREWWVGPKDDPVLSQEVLDMLVPYMHHVIG